MSEIPGPSRRTRQTGSAGWGSVADSLRRERVTGRLTDLWRCGFALVVAPAGWGKSTVAAHLAESSDASVVWYRAKSGDDQQATVLERIAASIAETASIAEASEMVAESDAGGGPGSGSHGSDRAGARAGLETPPISRAQWVSEVQSVSEDLSVPELRARLAKLVALFERPVLLVVDDLHVLGEGPEAVIGDLVSDLPPGVAVLGTSRVPPTFDLSRLRIQGRLIELGADDLRFRTWEVETLFRDVYRVRLAPEELADLARRTEGWAACLQLFHLATAQKSPQERRQVLSSLGSRSRLVREYLTRNVLDDLPTDLHDFLVRTCVLRELTGELCDALLDRSASESLLEELESRQIFTSRLDGGGTYHYHEILRSHLELELLEVLGEEGTRAAYRQAGYLLEETGSPGEALWAFCRAGDLSSAARVLGSDGAELAGRAGTWLEALPSSMIGSDPWLMLAQARNLAARGALTGALDAYEQAEGQFGPAEAKISCRQERQAVAAWTTPLPPPASNWTSVLRSALYRDPVGAMKRASEMEGPTGRFAEGAAGLLAGKPHEAIKLMWEVTSDPEAPATLVSMARLLAALAGMWTLDRHPGTARDLEELEGRFDRTGYRLPARLARAAQVASGWLPASMGPELRDACRADGDQWGESVISVFELAGDVLRGSQAGHPGGSAVRSDPVELSRRLVDMGSPVLGSWVLALAGHRHGLAGSEVMSLVDSGVLLARSSANPGAELLADVARSRVSGIPHRSEASRAEEALSAWVGSSEPLGGGPSSYRQTRHLARVSDPLAESGAVQPFTRSEVRGSGMDRESHATTPRWPRALGRGVPGDLVPERAEDQQAGDEPTVRLRCFGGFTMTVGGHQVAEGSIRPRPRALLHLLAVSGGRAIHREELLDALWCDATPESALRSLQVAVSTVRRLLDSAVGSGYGSKMVVRIGDAYRLLLPPGSVSDVDRFEHLLRNGHELARKGDTVAASELFEQGLALYDDLLPEDGPAEWVVKPREAFRLDAVTASGALARCRLQLEDPNGAVSVCEWGLTIDRFRDDLWRVLAEAHEAAGTPAAARRAVERYEAMLDELGVGRSL